MNINEQEQLLFKKWTEKLNITEDEFVADGLLFHGGLKFDSMNWVRTESGDNTKNWNNAERRLLIITRDQPCDDGNIWDVRGETPIAPDGSSMKKIQMYKCLIPWSYAALHFDNIDEGICPNDDQFKINFWMNAPIARMNCGKVAGNRVKDGGCPRSKVVEYLTDYGDFILNQIKLYNANIIICCSGYDSLSNPVVSFLKDNYLPDLEKINCYVWASKSHNKIVVDSYHFSNPCLWSDQSIFEEAEKIRNSIKDAISKGYSIL